MCMAMKNAPYKKRSKGGEWRSTGGAWGNVGSNLANQRLPKMRKCQHHHSILYSIPCVEATLTHGDGQFLLYIVTAETNPSASQKRLHLFLFYIQWSEALWPVVIDHPHIIVLANSIWFSQCLKLKTQRTIVRSTKSYWHYANWSNELSPCSS